MSRSPGTRRGSARLTKGAPLTSVHPQGVRSSSLFFFLLLFPFFFFFFSSFVLFGKAWPKKIRKEEGKEREGRKRREGREKREGKKKDFLNVNPKNFHQTPGVPPGVPALSQSLVQEVHDFRMTLSELSGSFSGGAQSPGSRICPELKENSHCIHMAPLCSVHERCPTPTPLFFIPGVHNSSEGGWVSCAAAPPPTPTQVRQ